jgi:hypothetical protein
MNAAKNTTLDTFVDDTGYRVRRRSDAAKTYIEQTGGGFKAKAGLFVANATDRTKSFFGDPETAGWFGALDGGIKGAMIGFGAFVVLAAGSLVTATMAPLLVCAGLGALLVGGYDGYLAHKEAQQTNAKKSGFETANNIARVAGALPPSQEISPYESVEQTMRNAGLDPNLSAQADEELKRTATPSFTSRVEQSRMTPATGIKK